MMLSRESVLRPVLLALFLGHLALTLAACTPQYPKCEGDNHCRSGEFCVNGLCQQCRDQSQCGACQQCSAGRCVAIELCCGGDQDCAAGQRCRDGRCAGECQSQAECGPRQICQGQRCVPVACLEDGDCPAGQRCLDHACSAGPECSARIHFDFDQSTLTAEARSILDGYSTCLKGKSEKEQRVVEGHCDERGTVEYNLTLGDRRARAAAGYLGRLGIEGLRPISYGEARPLVQGDDEQSWAQNRRVEFKKP